MTQRRERGTEAHVHLAPLQRARRHAADVELRAASTDRLAARGTEASSATSPMDALGAVTRMIQTCLGVRRCEMHVWSSSREMELAAFSGSIPPLLLRTGAQSASAPCIPDASRLVQWVADHGHPAAECADGTLKFCYEVDTVSPCTAPSFHPVGAHRLLLPLRVNEHTVGVLALLDDRAIAPDADDQDRLAALSYYAARAAARMERFHAAEHVKVAGGCGATIA